MRSYNNGLKTVLLLSSLFVLMFFLGKAISIGTGNNIFTYIFSALGLGVIFFSYWNSATMALKSMNAYPVNETAQPQMHKIVKELSIKANQPMPKLYVAPTMSPNAFATGRNPKNAAVCCTQGILNLLNERELRGVLAHELMHVYNKDILTSSIAAGLGSLITSFAHIFMFSNNRNNNQGNLISSAFLLILAPIVSTIIQFAISRTREYDADEDGAKLCEDPLALASALKKLENGISKIPITVNNKTDSVSSLMIANPFGGINTQKLFSTHPPTSERVKRLEKIAGY